MTATEYYEVVKSRARELRRERQWAAPTLGLNQLKRLCLDKGVEKIDIWPPSTCKTAKKRTKIRGIYAPNGGHPCIMVSRFLPKEQRLFTLGHELKHHLYDGDTDSLLLCEKDVQNNTVEISAEIFASELIYPDEDFCRDLKARGVRVGACTAEDLVRLKHATETALSHAALAKKAYRFNFAPRGAFEKVAWFTLRRRLFGDRAYLSFRRSRS